MARPKRLAFVDYALDNWHSNTYLGYLRGALKGRGWEVAGCHAMREAEGRRWAAKNRIPYCASPVELNDRVDAFLVMAPSNPETHLALVRRVVRFGKPVWVDKTFAPDLATAKAIFALADAHRVPLETNSALRFTAVQAYAREVGRDAIRHMVVWGGGGRLEEYTIHPLELLVSCMGPKAERVMRRGKGEEAQLLIDFSGGRTAVVNVYIGTNTDFAASVTTKQATRYIPVDGGVLFRDATAGILNFLEKRRPTFDRKESLVIRRLIDLTLSPATRRAFVKV
ncbi:MAG: Gfo/Idh/MocA family oxidoreductase [Candidatus Coatesbacteria bacterium]